MSGAVIPLMSCDADMSAPEPSEPDQIGVKPESEREIEERADHDRDDVVAASPARDRERARVAAALERDAVEHRPGEDRAEQDDAAEIAVGDEMGERPQLHPDQHRMLEHALDVAADIGRDDIQRELKHPMLV